LAMLATSRQRAEGPVHGAGAVAQLGALSIVAGAYI
jgi:hypothetical protein